MEVKNFDDIKIKEVSEKAGIGRATFYRNFDYVEDVLGFLLQYEARTLAEFLNGCIASRNLKGTQEMLFFFQFWTGQKDVLVALVKANRWHLFNNWFNTASDIRLDQMSSELQLTELERDYVQATWNGMITAMLHNWIKRGTKETAEDLRDLMEIPFRVFLHREYNIDFETSNSAKEVSAKLI